MPQAVSSRGQVGQRLKQLAGRGVQKPRHRRPRAQLGVSRTVHQRSAQRLPWAMLAAGEPPATDYRVSYALNTPRNNREDMLQLE